MIKFVFNGYYRSGTTIFYRIIKDRIIKESNPYHVCLCEPLNGIFAITTNPDNELETTSIDYAMNLHGFNPFIDYYKLDLPYYKKSTARFIKDLEPIVM